MQRHWRDCSSSEWRSFVLTSVTRCEWRRSGREALGGHRRFHLVATSRTCKSSPDHHHPSMETVGWKYNDNRLFRGETSIWSKVSCSKITFIVLPELRSYTKKCGKCCDPTKNWSPELEKWAVLMGKFWKLTVLILGLDFPSTLKRDAVPFNPATRATALWRSGLVT